MGSKNKPNKVKKKDRAKFDKVNAMYREGEGHWVTVNGQHLYVAQDKKKR